MKDEHLIDAFSAWEALSQTPDTIIAYHSRLKAIIDEEARLDSALHRGLELKAKKIAQKLIMKGASNEDIHDLTDLSYKEIEELRAEK